MTSSKCSLTNGFFDVVAFEFGSEGSNNFNGCRISIAFSFGSTKKILILISNSPQPLSSISNGYFSIPFEKKKKKKKTNECIINKLIDNNLNSFPKKIKQT